MKIQLSMVSGKEVLFETDKFDTLSGFMSHLTKGNGDDEVILELGENEIIFFSKVESIKKLK